MISVVVPAFNEEKYINECLKSLTTQDFKGEYEVLVVNNSCTDNTVSIARSYGLRIVNCSEKGVIYARQKGADVARGDIVVQADADTVYPADWLSRIHQHFSSDGDINAVAGFFLYREPPTWSWLEYWIRKTGNNIVGKPLLRRPLFVSGANFAFRKDAFVKTGGYNHNEMYPDQWGVCRSLSREGKIIYDPSLVAYTSCRRVKKPFIKIVFETARNLANVIKYFIMLPGKTQSPPESRKAVQGQELVIALLVTGLIMTIIHIWTAPPQFIVEQFHKSKTQEIMEMHYTNDSPYGQCVYNMEDKNVVPGTVNNRV